MAITRVPVESSNIREIGHDETGLEVLFYGDDRPHFYPGVTADEHMRLMSGVGTNGSIGRYFNRFIKPRYE